MKRFKTGGMLILAGLVTWLCLNKNEWMLWMYDWLTGELTAQDNREIEYNKNL